MNLQFRTTPERCPIRRASSRGVRRARQLSPPSSNLPIAEHDPEELFVRIRRSRHYLPVPPGVLLTRSGLVSWGGTTEVLFSPRKRPNPPRHPQNASNRSPGRQPRAPPWPQRGTSHTRSRFRPWSHHEATRSHHAAPPHQRQHPYLRQPQAFHAGSLVPPQATTVPTVYPSWSALWYRD